MSGIQDYIKQIEAAKAYINDELPEVVAKIASNDLSALITNRVIQKSESYTGAKFGKYSERKMSYKKLVPSVLAASGRGKVDEIKKISTKEKGISYARVREILGRTNTNKNFFLSGEMFQKFGVIKTTKEKGKFKIQLGGQTPASQKKIDANTDREKINIIEASKEEEALIESIVGEIFEEKMQELL